jgi:hypothetical protein
MPESDDQRAGRAENLAVERALRDRDVDESIKALREDAAQVNGNLKLMANRMAAVEKAVEKQTTALEQAHAVDEAKKEQLDDLTSNQISKKSLYIPAGVTIGAVLLGQFLEHVHFG